MSWLNIMKYKKTIQIVSLISFLIFLNSCKKDSNPVFPINMGNTKILFSANNKLAIINADGSNYKIIPTETNNVSVANLSYNASEVVYGGVDSTPQQIFLYNINTNGTIRITNDSLFHDSPSISPVDNSVIFTSRIGWMNKLYSADVNNGNARLLDNNLNVYNPTFSSDGSKIACWINNGGDSVGIVVMNKDGSNPKLIVKGYYPEFSPDGQKIIYQNPSSTNEEGLYIMDIDGTDNKFISNIPYQTQPMFSPDGSKIVFSNFTDNFDIYLINSDGSNLVNLTNSNDGETQPVFSSDGSKIVFVRYDITSKNDKLCSMNIDGSNQKVIYEDNSNSGIKIF